MIQPFTMPWVAHIVLLLAYLGVLGFCYTGQISFNAPIAGFWAAIMSLAALFRSVQLNEYVSPGFYYTLEFAIVLMTIIFFLYDLSMYRQRQSLHRGSPHA